LHSKLGQDPTHVGLEITDDSLHWTVEVTVVGGYKTILASGFEGNCFEAFDVFGSAKEEDIEPD